MRLQTPLVVRVFFAAFVLLGMTSVAQADDISGNWSGTHYMQTTECLPLWTGVGAATVDIVQSGNSFSGTAAIPDWSNPDVHDTPKPCELETVSAIAFSLSDGIVDGSSFTANAAIEGDGGIPVTGSVTSDTMTLTVSFGPQDFFRFTVRRTVVATSNAIVSAFPLGMVAAVGDETLATDSFSLTNNGDAPADVTLAQDGGFFALSDTLLTLAAGETRTITVQAPAQSAAGVLEGSVTASGTGVAVGPIRVVLLSATPPTSDARIAPPAARRETRGAASQTAAGTASFLNETSAAISAIAVADVPWIIPQAGLITLPPGHPTSVSYTVDRSKRSDAASPIGGGESGKLSLRFIGTATAAPFSIQTPSIHTQATTSLNITTVSATIVDVVQAGSYASPFPPLAAGEVAYFFAGLGSLGNVVTDLLLSNPGTALTSDLKLYFTSTSPGATTKLLDLTRLIAPNLAVSFPSMASNVYGADGQSGSLQLRGSSASAVSVAAVRLASNVLGRYATALPMLRSDAAAGAGEQVILSGVEKTASTRTNLYIQETSGHNGSVRIDFLDANGQPVSARVPDSVKGFGTLELSNAVPAGAVVARIATVNDSSGARFAAYALVIDDVTSDAWVVSDLVRSSTPASASFVAPLPSVNTSPLSRNVSLTNVGASPITATVDGITNASRRRAVVHSESIASEAVQSFVLTPMQTVSATVPLATGYLRLTAPSGTLNGSARMTTTTPGAFGAGLVAVPTASALSIGQSQQFTGVDDPSPATIAASTPGTQRSSLVLIETAGQSATVRVTMRFTFPGGSKVSGIGLVTRDIPLRANQMITSRNIGQFVIGDQRSAFGDLWNTQIDVDVVGGAGRVVALIQAVDNGSGDVLMRVD